MNRSRSDIAKKKTESTKQNRSSYDVHMTECEYLQQKKNESGTAKRDPGLLDLIPNRWCKQEEWRSNDVVKKRRTRHDCQAGPLDARSPSQRSQGRMRQSPCLHSSWPPAAPARSGPYSTPGWLESEDVLMQLRRVHRERDRAC